MNIFKVLFADTHTKLSEKNHALHRLILDIQDKEEELENASRIASWASIGSAIGTAFCAAGTSVLNPLVGSVILSASALSGAIAITSGAAQIIDSKLTIKRVRRIRQAIQSRDLIDWATVWHVLGDDDKFRTCLQIASRGYLSESTLKNNQNISPFNIAVKFVAEDQNFTVGETTKNLANIKSKAQDYNGRFLNNAGEDIKEILGQHYGMTGEKFQETIQDYLEFEKSITIISDDDTDNLHIEVPKKYQPYSSSEVIKENFTGIFLKDNSQLSPRATHCLAIIKASTNATVTFDSIRNSRAWVRDFKTTKPTKELLRDALTELKSNGLIHGSESEGYSLS